MVHRVAWVLWPFYGAPSGSAILATLFEGTCASLSRAVRGNRALGALRTLLVILG